MSAGAANLVPHGLNCMDFTAANEDVVATEELSIDELASGVSENDTIADDGASDPEGNAGDALHSVTSGTAAAAVDKLRMYRSSEAGVGSYVAISEAAVLKRALTKRVQGTFPHFFRKFKVFCSFYSMLALF